MGKVRVVRSDKKVDCKPTIPIHLKECIYRISYITNTPVKDVAEHIVVSGIRSRKVIELLSVHFRRDLQIGNTFYLGDLNNVSLQRMKNGEKNERITTRFKQSDYELIRALAFSLDVTPSRATALLLEKTIHKTNFINGYAKTHLKGSVNEARMKELRNIINYINRANKNEEQISWVNMLSFFYDELKESATTMNKAISNWIDKTKR